MDLSSIEQIIRTRVPNASSDNVELYLDSVDRVLSRGGDYSDMSEDDVVEDFEYYIQSRMDEIKKPTTKMKRNELKEMIKAAFMAENTGAAVVASDYDPLYEAEEEKSLDDMLADIIGTEKDPYMAEDLYEAEEEEEEIEVDTEEETDGGEEAANDSIVVDKKIVSLSSLPNDTRKILDALEILRSRAAQLKLNGSKESSFQESAQKLIDQVRNTIIFFTREFVGGSAQPTKAKVDEVESKELKVGEKVDVFNKGGKYQGWGRNEYLYNSEIVDITGEKVTVKDINDDEYEVDSSDISKLDESVAFPMWNKIK